MSETHDDILYFEKKYLEQGHKIIAGIDEAGRGAWAGPVSAAAVILPLDHENLLDELDGVRDSKRCTPLQRDRLYEVIREIARAVGVGLASQQEVDQWGIVPASKLAMARAVEALKIRPKMLLIDGHYMQLRDINLPQEAFNKGEAKSLSIAAASIIAKVERDRYMIDMGDHYPDYGFARHKGYGTVQHRMALGEFGPCDLHRRTFRPIRERLDNHDGGDIT
jgi:ribonuclease HII